MRRMQRRLFPKESLRGCDDSQIAHATRRMIWETRADTVLCLFYSDRFTPRERLLHLQVKLARYISPLTPLALDIDHSIHRNLSLRCSFLRSPINTLGHEVIQVWTTGFSRPLIYLLPSWLLRYLVACCSITSADTQYRNGSRRLTRTFGCGERALETNRSRQRLDTVDT